MFAMTGWRVQQGAPHRAHAREQAELLCWQDPATPLSIWHVGDLGTKFFRLRLADLLMVDIEPARRIVARPSAGLPQVTIDHFLADQVYPRLLAHEGSLVIHAGAVLVDDAALLFVGESGRGKSTLTASFDQTGNALLGDDAIVISSVDHTPHACPVYPSLRLLPDSIAALMPGAATAGPVAHYSRKERIDVAVDREIGGTAIPVRAIFSISDATTSEIGIRPLPAAQACMTLVANSFALDPTDVDQAHCRMDEASALARQVPAFEISYPRDYARLPEVRQAILDQVAAMMPA